jgi:hypothetical protein
MSTDNEVNNEAVEATVDDNGVSLTAIIAEREAQVESEVSGDAVASDNVVEKPVAETPAAEAAPVVDEVAEMRARLALYEDILGDDITSGILGVEQPVAQQSTSDNVAKDEQGNESASVEDLLSPREFVVSQEEYDDALSGDANKFQEIINRRDAVTTHNLRLEMNTNIVKAIEWYLPATLAAKSFNDRYPEMAMWPKSGEIINAAMMEAKKKLPHANEAQLLRAVEKRLEPVIKRCKEVVAESAQKRTDAGQSQPPSARTAPARTANVQTRGAKQISDLEYAQNLLRQSARA